MAEALLKDRDVHVPLDIAQAMAWARKTYGTGLFRQAAQVIALSRHARMTAREYCDYALFRPTIGPGERRAYLSARTEVALNLRLSPVGLRGLHGLCNDKVLCAAVLAQAGLPTVPTLAVFSRQMAVPNLPRLASPEALAAWLLTDAPLPVFGKPLDGSMSIGGVSLTGREGDSLVFGDGRKVPAAALATEIARDYSHGWMVQPLLRLHPEVAALAGAAVAMLRIVTLRDADGTAALYAFLRLPAPGAMVDSPQKAASNGYVVVDPATGALGRAQLSWQMCSTAADIAPATGAVLAGRRLPFVPEAVRLCETAHLLFPQQGVLGFDVALTPDGPVISEINSMPHHHVWQRAADRGLMNPDFAPRIAAAIAETRRRAARAGDEARRIAGKPRRAVAPGTRHT